MDPMQMEQSLRAFASRPENKPLLEQHQREEVAAAVALQEQAQQLALLEQIRQLDPADQQLLGPVLASPALTQVLVSLSSDARSGGSSSSSGGGGTTSGSGLHGWLGNPRVLQLLREAARALRRGRITEQQLAALMLQQAKESEAAEAADAEPRPAPHQALLPSHLLVDALNEHLAERQAGNKAYQQQQFDAAMLHYTRALAITNFVVAQNAADAAEVARNKAAVLLNMAAVHMATQDFGAAVCSCSDALAMPAACDVDFAVKALLRRCKANIGRHEYAAALDDLGKAAQLQPWHDDIPRLRAKVLHAQQRAAQETDKTLAASMFKPTRG